MKRINFGTLVVCLCAFSVTLAACGSGSGGGSSSGGGGSGATTYTLGGALSGLTASGLVLAAGGQTVSLAANATSFTFATAEASGTSYSVTVSSQPSGSTCAVANGSGTISSSNITNIQVTCAANNMSGTAATGSAIAGATVTLVDGKGTQVTTKTDSSGNYSLSSTGLTAPFLVKVVTASASANGYAAGTTFYSVSDQATPSVLNITPLTDLIIRNWYAAQSSPVPMAMAFANPAANPPPSVGAVQLIQAVVLDIVQPVLQQNGINPVGLDLISGAFTANSQGVDGALDQIQPVTYNSSGTSASLTIATTSITTQTTTVTASAGSTQVATTTSNTSSGTTSSIVTSVVVPTSSGEAAALAGAQTTLTSLGGVIQSKGSALLSSDVAQFIDSNFLDGGTTGPQQAQQIAAAMAGATINSFTVTRITSYDSTNNLIGIIGTVNYTENGVTGSARIGHDSDQGMIFKEEADGGWLMYGDQQQVKSHAQITSQMNNDLDGTTWSGQTLDVQVSVLAASTATPCASGSASSVTAFPVTAISATNQNTSAAVTLGTSGYSLGEDPAVYQDNGGNTCHFDGLVNGFLVLPPSNLAAVVGDTIGFSLNGGSPIPALARTIPGYTTETVNFTNLSSHALPAAQLGQPLTLTWNLPVTFPVYAVQVYGLVEVVSGSSYVSCEAEPAVPLSVTSTSATITLPATCNGISVVSIPQSGSQPAAVQVNVVIQGTHGEIAQAWWPFN